MPAVLDCRLSAPERRSLVRLQSRSQHPRLVKRVTALLLLEAGKPTCEILDTLGISRRTLVNWKQRWLRRRHFGLEDGKHTGRRPRATPAYIKKMVTAVEQDPREYKYAFTRWTAPRLAEYLFESTDIRLTPQWVTELLRIHGFVWRRTKRTIRNLQKPSTRERARRALKRLKRGF